MARRVVLDEETFHVSTVITSDILPISDSCVFDAVPLESNQTFGAKLYCATSLCLHNNIYLAGGLKLKPNC